jgi:hypothetical protein
MGYEKPKQEFVTKKLHELVDASKKMNESKEEILKLKYEYFFNIFIYSIEYRALRQQVQKVNLLLKFRSERGNQS